MPRPVSPTARYHLVRGYEDAAEFAHKVGYPVVVKPDNGVGASQTYRLRNDDELHFFIDHMDEHVYIMEEFVNGYVRTYDAVIDSQGNALFETGNITPHSLMDIVNDHGESLYYIVKELPEEVRDVGLRTVKAFGVRSRFVHLEYFVLNEDQEGLGKKGDIIGLEVNMRPSGGYTPDMYNFAHETDVYRIWADMIAFDKSTVTLDRPRHNCAFVGRRDGKNYKLDHDAVIAKYGPSMKMWGRVPDALSGAMANQMYVCNFDTEEEVWDFYREVMETN